MLNTLLPSAHDDALSFSLSLVKRSWTALMWVIHAALTFLRLLGPITSVPVGFPSSGNGLWYITPGKNWANEFLPVGNGYLGAMVPGGMAQERTQLNVETLWSGGPFDDPSYNGGNKDFSEISTTAQTMQNIRQTIFFSQTGDIDSIEGLTTPAGAYGSYAGSGYLLSSLHAGGSVARYARWLDLDQGLARTSWTQGGKSYLRTTFCSHSSRACVERISSTPTSFFATNSLPELTYAFASSSEIGLPVPNVTCLDANTLSVRGRVTLSPTSMIYEMLFRVSTPSVARSSVRCLPLHTNGTQNATIRVAAGSTPEAWVTWVGATDYSIDAGDAAHNFTFRGDDPHASLLSLLSAATSSSYQDSFDDHVHSYNALLNEPFSLSLGQSPKLDVPTDILRARYQVDVGDPYLEWLTFNLGRYLLASSAPGVLPTNLQGVWADGWANAWGADYHANINIQMNYWVAEMTNLDVTRSLFDYLEKTWVPRGEYTARVLYNISRGWVTHNEMNIFGHTGMKGGGGNTAQWANYPESNAWMMLHVWDHFDYTLDVAWWKSQGWPLLKGAAEFHLDKLLPDLHFNDSTLVVNPCNSPEQYPITLGCAHAQQLIWQLFNAVIKGFVASGDTDYDFLGEVLLKRQQMDKGLHIGSWGQLKEWKIERDSPVDTHRHLSHLIGLYPGYAIASYSPALQGGKDLPYSRDDILGAASVSLLHRGNGTGPDADAGWEKAWRAAAWAQLGDPQKFYHELTYTISQNFGSNLLSLYDPFSSNPIFQIDANLAYPAAVMNALVQSPDVPTLDSLLYFVLLPALPSQWPSGYVRNVRVRGGLTIQRIIWQSGKLTNAEFKVDDEIALQRNVAVVYDGKQIASFVTTPGHVETYSRF